MMKKIKLFLSKNSKIKIVVRWILSLLLLWGVYSETGVWTTLTLFLIVLTFEAKRR